MLTLVLLASISALAMNIYLPSLPQIAMEFSTTPAAMSLSVGVYLGTSALIQLFAAPFRTVLVGANCPSFVDYLCNCIHQLRLCAKLETF